MIDDKALAELAQLATSWLFDDGYMTGRPEIDEPTEHRASAKRECALALREKLDALRARQTEAVPDAAIEAACNRKDGTVCVGGDYFRRDMCPTCERRWDHDALAALKTGPVAELQVGAFGGVHLSATEAAKSLPRGNYSLYTAPQPAPAAAVDESWREGWALAYSGPALYRDDGELQDNQMQPFIDWRRDSAATIRTKITERGNRIAAAQQEVRGGYTRCGHDQWADQCLRCATPKEPRDGQ